jgi:hypothetical protein
MSNSLLSTIATHGEALASNHLFLIPVSILASLLVLRLWRSAASRQKAAVPFVRFEDRNAEINYMEAYAGVLSEGYSKYSANGLPFQIFHPHNVKNPWVILPFKYLHEVKWAQESRLSLRTFLDQRSCLPDIGGPRLTDHVAHSIRVGMNRALRWFCLVTCTKSHEDANRVQHTLCHDSRKHALTRLNW